MKVQEVMCKAMSGEISWVDAAEILGVSCRTMRRWKWRAQAWGYEGLLDRRRQQPSPKRVPRATVETVLRLYRAEYSDFNVRHFHEKLVAEHGIELSYEWVKTALQMAGLVAKRRVRGPHRKRRERRPLPGMMLHCDGSTHAWLGAEAGRQDLIAFLDDATNEVLAAYLVEEEGTLSVMAGLKEVLQEKGLFCSLYTDRGSHFFHTTAAGAAVDRSRLTQIGRCLAGLGIEHIPSYSPQARGRMERFFETWQGRLPQELRRAGVRTKESANRYLREVFMPWHNRALTVKAREEGDAFVPSGAVELDAMVCIQEERVVGNDNTVSYGNRRLQIEPSRLRVSFAKCRVKVCEQVDGILCVRYGPHVLGRYGADGKQLSEPAAMKKAA
jgi:transposase